MNRGNSIIAGVVLIGILGSLSIALQATAPVPERMAQVQVSPRAQVAATHAPALPEEIVCIPGFTYKTWNKTVNGKTDIAVECAQLVGMACGKGFGDLPGATEEKYKKAGATLTCIQNAKNGRQNSANKDITQCQQPAAGQPQCPMLVHCFKTNAAGTAPIESSCVKLKNSTVPEGKGFVPQNNQHFALKQLQVDAVSGGDGAGDAAKMLAGLAQDSSMRSALDSAFREQVAEQALAVKNSDPNIACYECSDVERAAQQKRYEEEQRKLAEMQAMQKRLASARTGRLAQHNLALSVDCIRGPSTPGGGGGTGGGAGAGGGGGQRPPSNTLPPQNQNQQRPPQQPPYNNPYQQCYPQYFCMNNALYWGTPQQAQSQQYNYGYGYGQNCTNQHVQACQFGCAPPTNSQFSTQCAQNPQNPNPNPGGQNQPTATLSCGSGGLFDIGMSVPVSFSCGNSVSSTGNGFSTGGALSGSASTTIQKPPPGTDIVSYGLTCSASNGQTASSRCDVKINVAAVVMVANPKKAKKDNDADGDETTIGWVTKGMKACVVSAVGEKFSAWNSEQATITNTSGAAKAPDLDETTEFILTCTTQGGKTKESRVKVEIES